jgi:hypothetical protein
MGRQVQPDLVFGAGLRTQLGSSLPWNGGIRAKVLGFVGQTLQVFEGGDFRPRLAVLGQSLEVQPLGLEISGHAGQCKRIGA